MSGRKNQSETSAEVGPTAPNRNRRRAEQKKMMMMSSVSKKLLSHAKYVENPGPVDVDDKDAEGGQTQGYLYEQNPKEAMQPKKYNPLQTGVATHGKS